MVQYRTIKRTITLTPTSTVTLDVLALDNSVSVTAIAKVFDMDLTLLSKNTDGTITFQVSEVQQFTP